MKILAVTLVCVLVVSGVVRGAEGGATPSIQTLMDRSLAVDTWSSGKSSEPAKPATTTEHRSMAKAVLLSTLVPGGGQYYNGKRLKARYFFAAEASIWLAFAAFHINGDWRRDDYIAYAAEHANAQLQDRDDDFADMVGFYDDIVEYNTLGRAFDPERPYLPDTPENHWRWQSEDERMVFRDIKNGARESYRRADFMIGLAVINRVVSVIDAVLDTRRANRRITSGFSTDDRSAVKLAIDPMSLRRQVCVTFYPDF